VTQRLRTECMRLILLTLPSAAEPVPLDACFEAGLQTLHVRKPDWTRPQLRAYLQTVAPRYHRRLVLHSCHELSAEFDVAVSGASIELVSPATKFWSTAATARVLLRIWGGATPHSPPWDRSTEVRVMVSTTALSHVCDAWVDVHTQGVHYTERSRPEAPIRRPREGLTVSTSFHKLAQLRADWGGLDYAFLSPVYDSISKTGYGAAFEEAALGAALRTATVPVVALGGEEAVRRAGGQLLHMCTACDTNGLLSLPSMLIFAAEACRYPARHCRRGCCQIWANFSQQGPCTVTIALCQ